MFLCGFYSSNGIYVVPAIETEPEILLLDLLLAQWVLAIVNPGIPHAKTPFKELCSDHLLVPQLAQRKIQEILAQVRRQQQLKPAPGAQPPLPRRK